MNGSTNKEHGLGASWYCLALTSLLFLALWNVPLASGQVPVVITDSETPVALTANNTGSASTYVLNADSSVSVLQNSVLVSGAGCGPIASFLNGGRINQASIYFDPSSNNLYAAMEADSSTGSGLGTFTTYVTINSNGTCTQGPTVQVSTISFSTIELGVDPAQGIVYVLQATEGASLDTLYVLTIADFSTYADIPSTELSTLPQVPLDYSSSYGPILVDPSTHRVYINDLGGLEDSPAPGLILTPGFFVYDPNNNPTVTNNIQHVYGYVNSSGTSMPLNAQTLLVNTASAGDLIVVNQNTSLANGKGATYQSAPFTILHTKASGFSFFSNLGPSGPSGSVYIQPGTSGVTVIGPSSDATLLYYSATGSADIDSANGIVYRFAYNANGTTAYNITLVQDSGALIAYNLSTMQDQLLAGSLPMANVYPSPALAAWNQLTYIPESNSVMVTVADALGVSNSLGCAGLSIQQVLGGGSTLASLLPPSANFASGYAYAITSSYPKASLYYVAPGASCAVTDLNISPTLLPPGVAGQSYGPVQFSVTSGAEGTVTFSSLGAPNNLGISPSGSFSGTPVQVGTFEVTVNAKDSQGDTGMETLPLTISCQTITAGPTPLPGGVIGVPYSFNFTQTGGIGAVTYSAYGPFPPGIGLNATSTGLSGIPTTAGSWQIGIQVKDSNGCQSANLIQTLTIAAPRFAMAPIPPGGLSGCPAPGPGFPLGVVPTVTFNSVSAYAVTVTIFNSGNVAAIANLVAAPLGGFPTVNAPLPGVPIILGTSGAPLEPGQCVTLTFFYPTAFFTGSAPLSGFTLANIPQVLRLGGTYNIVTTLGTGPTSNWSLTDREVLLNSTICCTNPQGVLTGETLVNGIP